MRGVSIGGGTVSERRKDMGERRKINCMEDGCKNLEKGRQSGQRNSRELEGKKKGKRRTRREKEGKKKN